MAATPSSNSKSSGDRKPDDPIPLTFEEKLTAFWQKNQAIVIGLCVLVLVVLIGRGVWERVQRQKEREVENAYAAATTPDQLRAFVAAHPGHELAAVAEVRLADQAYKAGKFAEASTDYNQAVAQLKSGPLASRARLGAALAEVQGGKTTQGTADLKQLAGDTSLLNAVRAEAAYNLAALAADAGNATEAQRYIDQLNQIDPASLWARRALALEASLPTPPPSAAPLGSPAANQSSSTGSTESSQPSIKLKLPSSK